METVNGVWIRRLQLSSSKAPGGNNFKLSQLDPTQQRQSSISQVNPRRSKQGQLQRLHQYIFYVDDKGLDLSGFIIQAEKKRGKRHHFRVFLDSNGNTEFDKSDQLIGKTRLNKNTSMYGIGGLLEPGEVGELDIDFKLDSFSSITRFRFFNSTDKKIASFRNKKAISPSPTLLAEPTNLPTLDSSSLFDDDEWRQSWDKYCGKDAKPPYPEDCFFNLLS